MYLSAYQCDSASKIKNEFKFNSIQVYCLLQTYALFLIKVK